MIEGSRIISQHETYTSMERQRRHSGPFILILIKLLKMSNSGIFAATCSCRIQLISLISGLIIWWSWTTDHPVSQTRRHGPLYGTFPSPGLQICGLWVQIGSNRLEVLQHLFLDDSVPASSLVIIRGKDSGSEMSEVSLQASWNQPQRTFPRLQLQPRAVTIRAVFHPHTQEATGTMVCIPRSSQEPKRKWFQTS